MVWLNWDTESLSCRPCTGRCRIGSFWSVHAAAINYAISHQLCLILLVEAGAINHAWHAKGFWCLGNAHRE